MQLAVYGTLKSGYSNHYILKDCRYVGAAWVDNFALLDEGYYPAAFRFAGRKVMVEVYEVDDLVLARTDRLEGVDRGYYTRETVKTKYGEVFMYARMDRPLAVGRTEWFPDGIWEADESYKVPWLGWDAEIRLTSQLKADRFDRKTLREPGKETKDGVYVPPPRRSGQLIKVYNTEKDVYEYVPEADAAGLPRYKPGDEPKPTKMETARAMIKEAVAKNPDIPKEKIA
jgi:gamma-glutamylcyclotransferase (GGCT)/AIG2-like uncharacterized protein YtfP